MIYKIFIEIREARLNTFEGNEDETSGWEKPLNDIYDAVGYYKILMKNFPTDDSNGSQAGKDTAPYVKQSNDLIVKMC